MKEMENKYKYLLFKIDKGRNRILDVFDIIMIEKISNSEINIICKDNEFIIRSTLGNIMSLMISNKIFFQCHRSYIINIKYVDRIENYGNFSEVYFRYTNKKALMSKQGKKKISDINILGII